MKTLHLVSMALAILSLSACGPRALTQAQQIGLYEVTAPEREVTTPPIGEQAMASVGSSIISISRERRSEYLTVETPLAINQKDSDEDQYQFSVPPGRFKLTHKDSQGSSYFPVGRFKQVWFERGKPNGKNIVLVDYKVATNGTLSLIWAKVGDDFQEVSIQPLKYSIKAGDVESSPSSYRRELIYTGRSGPTLTLLYREFVNDMARPAFSQQLQYDVSADPVIGYQGARFHVLSADNTNIVYKLLSPLNIK